jgi:hypothetical protein
MQVNIRYSDVNKPINMNCKCAVILEYIRKLGNYDPGLLLDACDKDGNVRLLRQNPLAYATTCFTVGETYYLVSAAEEGKQFVYQMLTIRGEDEPEIEVKPTKIEKQPVTKRGSAKPTPKAKKSK